MTILFAQSQKPLVAPTEEEKTLNKVPLETKKGAEMKGDPGGVHDFDFLVGDTQLVFTTLLSIDAPRAR